MMHPDAGQAATAPGTPLGKRSAKMVFSRLRKATTPSKSVIWESCSAPPAANFGTVFGVGTAETEDGDGVARAATTEAEELAVDPEFAVVELVAEGTTVPVAVGAVDAVAISAVLVEATFAYAEAGNPPRVWALAASIA